MLTCLSCNKEILKKSFPSRPRKFCNKSCSNSYNTLQRGPVSQEILERMSIGNTGKKYPNRKRPTFTEEHCNNISIGMTKRTMKSSKYSKCTEYKPGVILESSYEVLTAQILDELSIEWIKVRKGFIWNDNGKTRRYVPDFFLPEFDIFLDPKNDYLITKDQRKINSAMELNSIVVHILSKEQINKEYIKSLVVVGGIEPPFSSL